VKGIIGRVFGGVGVSYHFCTFALSQAVPAICLYCGNYYSQKARGFSEFWKDSRLSLSLKNMDSNLAVKHILNVMEDNVLRSNLNHYTKEVINKWESTFDQHVKI
jgi:polysaccharide pyruvyl transferase WcaK-like protein